MNVGVSEHDLLGLVEGDLPADRAHAVRTALDADPTLKARLEAMTLDRAALRALGAARVSAPAGLIRDALARAEREALTPAEEPIPIVVHRFRAWRAAGIAAACLVAVGAVLLALRTGGGARGANPQIATNTAKTGVDRPRGHSITAKTHTTHTTTPEPEPTTLASLPPDQAGQTLTTTITVHEPGHQAGEDALRTTSVMTTEEGPAPEMALRGQGQGESANWYARELLHASHGMLEIRVVADDPSGVVQAVSDFGAMSGRSTSFLGTDSETGNVRAVVEFPSTDEEMYTLLSAISQVAGERSFFFEETTTNQVRPLVGAQPPRAVVSVRIEPSRSDR